MKSEQKTLKQFILYIMVGGCSALIELSVFYALSAIAGLSLSVANISAIVLATCFNFIANSKVSFREASNLTRSIILYLTLFFFNMAFSTLAINALADLLVPPIIAKVATMACIVLWNFVLYKKVVFV